MSDKEKALSKTERSLWNAIVSEAMALLKYNAYAHKALEEGYPEVAQVFQEVAGAETIHGVNHLKVSGDVKSSLDNLRNVVQTESREIIAKYPRMVRDALEEGRSDAAETFNLAMERERHHIEVFNKALEGLEAKLAETGGEPPVGEDHQTGIVSDTKQRDGGMKQPSYVFAYKEVENERWRVASLSRVRGVVFGAQDGLISILALVTSVAVAGVDQEIILIAGLAGALAGVISMATGEFLGSKAQQDLQKAEIAKEAEELEAHPAEELAELVVLYQREGLSFNEAREVADHISADKDLMLRTMVEKELGLSSEIVSNPVKDAFTMAGAFIVGAFIPVTPYFFGSSNSVIGASIAVTLVGLFVLGVGTARLAQKSPIVQGLQFLVIGAGSAGVGYVLGEVIPRLVT